MFPCLQHFLLSGVSRQCSSTNSHKTVGDSLERSSLLSKITHQKNWSNLKPDFFFQIWNLLFLGPCFSGFQQPFNFSCCYFAPGLDRLAAARDVTVSVTLADEERTGHLGMKRRFQQRLRKNVKNVGLTMLRRKCGSCFFSSKERSLGDIFFGLMFLSTLCIFYISS